MSKDSFDIIPLVKHSDKRGYLFEVLRFKDQNIPGEGYIYVFSVNPGERRGDHYHAKKQEWFSCVCGEAVILVEDKEGNKQKIILSADDPKLLYFGPGTAHAILNESGSMAALVSYGSKQHDPEDPDTFKKVIEM